VDLVTELAILVLAAFVGYEVISKVPNTLHTPLMSGTNAIHGIVLLGGLLLMAASSGALEKVLLVVAVMFGTINIIGGFFVTDRMLEMFKRKPEPAEAGRGAAQADGGGGAPQADGGGAGAQADGGSGAAEGDGGGPQGGSGSGGAEEDPQS
jgi:NAD(P) transhydrogenase subunit alpha